MNYAMINGKQVPLSHLQVIQVVASLLGFSEVDCEPTGAPGMFKVTVKTKEGDPPVVRRGTLEDCASQFAELVLTH